MMKDDRTEREIALGFPAQRLVSRHGVRTKPVPNPDGRTLGARIVDIVPAWLRALAARRPQRQRLDLDGAAWIARGESEQTCFLLPHRSDGGWLTRLRGMRIDDD